MINVLNMKVILPLVLSKSGESKSFNYKRRKGYADVEMGEDEGFEGRLEFIQRTDMWDNWRARGGITKEHRRLRSQLSTSHIPGNHCLRSPRTVHALRQR